MENLLFLGVPILRHFRVLKTRTCTEYTVKLVSFKIPIQYYLQVLNFNGTWTDARRPVQRLWIRSAEVPNGNTTTTSMERLHWNDYILSTLYKGVTGSLFKRYPFWPIIVSDSKKYHIILNQKFPTLI